MISKSETRSSSRIIFMVTLSYSRCWALMCLLPASANCAKLLSQNHFVESNWNGLTFCDQILICRVTYWAPVGFGCYKYSMLQLLIPNYWGSIQNLMLVFGIFFKVFWSGHSGWKGFTHIQGAHLWTVFCIDPAPDRWFHSLVEVGHNCVRFQGSHEQGQRRPWLLSANLSGIQEIQTHAAEDPEETSGRWDKWGGACWWRTAVWSRSGFCGPVDGTTFWRWDWKSLRGFCESCYSGNWITHM